MEHGGAITRVVLIRSNTLRTMRHYCAIEHKTNPWSSITRRATERTDTAQTSLRTTATR
jgi:hypothetical protein